MAAADDTVYYTSETQVFALCNGEQKRVSGVTTDQVMEVIVANDHSVYAGSNTGFVHKINSVDVTATAKLEGAKIIDLSAGSETVYVLSHRKEVYELDASTLEVRR